MTQTEVLELAWQRVPKPWDVKEDTYDVKIDPPMRSGNEKFNAALFVGTNEIDIAFSDDYRFVVRFEKQFTGGQPTGWKIVEPF